VNDNEHIYQEHTHRKGIEVVPLHYYVKCVRLL
jgi:hypothetical protein